MIRDIVKYTERSLTLNVDGRRGRLGALLLRGRADVLEGLFLVEDVVDLGPPQALGIV